jgi:hypothetical protein
VNISQCHRYILAKMKNFALINYSYTISAHSIWYRNNYILGILKMASVKNQKIFPGYTSLLTVSFSLFEVKYNFFVLSVYWCVLSKGWILAPTQLMLAIMTKCNIKIKVAGCCIYFLER